MAEGLQARQAAVALLMGVLGDRAPLSDLLDGPAWARLAAPDRARAQRLALEVLRQVEPIDRLLQSHLKREPVLEALNILRLGVVELAGGAAAHGVVNASVEMARRARHISGAAGMINAVLRKVPSGVVIEGVQQYQEKQELIALLKLLALGEKDRQAGLGLSVEASRAQLAQRRQQR